MAKKIISILLCTFFVAFLGGCSDLRALKAFETGVARSKADTRLQLFDANADGKGDFRIEDTNGDRVMDRYTWDTDFDGAFDLTRTRADIASSPLSVVICVDGVPYEWIRDLWNRGRFRDFYEPGLVVAAFPSITETALTLFYNSNKYIGYEDRYFNIINNRIEGGAFGFVLGGGYFKGTFYDHVDYYTSAMDNGLVYLWTESVANSDAAKLRKALFSTGALAKRIKGTPFIDLDGLYNEGKPVTLFGAYFLPTDAIGHKLGRKAVERHLVKIEALAREVIWRTRGRVNVALFSDHGMDGVPCKMIDYQGALKKAGLRKGDRLGPKVDLVIPAYGLISFLAAYTHRELKAKVAETLGTLEGAQLAVYRGPNGFPVVVSADGKAEIRYNGDMSRFKYLPIEGDPLKLKPLAAEMARKGLADELGYTPRGEWTRATLNHEYVDPLWRLSRAVTDQRLIDNRAQVLVSLKCGYYFGSRFFQAMKADLKGTHGNLAPQASHAFVLFTGGRQKGPMYHDELARWLKHAWGQKPASRETGKKE